MGREYLNESDWERRNMLGEEEGSWRASKKLQD